jgi:hypothetical protein
MDRHERELSLPAHPRPLAALFLRVLGHAIVLLEDLVDAVVVDREPSRALSMCAIAAAP